MGFFSRLIDDFANELTNSVERAANEIISPAVNKASETVANKVVQQIGQAEEAIYSAPPTFTVDKENYNVLVIASKDRLFFMDKVPGGEPRRVPLKMLSTLRFSVANHGNYQGNTDAANHIHSATINAMQQVFDECANKHMTMAAALENMKVLSMQVKQKMQQVYDSYAINPEYVVTYVIPSANSAPTGAAVTPEAKPLTWQCQYCGTNNDGKFCCNCGSPKPQM